MIIGAGGGTGHAVAWQCALENCERLVLVNRTLEKANIPARLLAPHHIVFDCVYGSSKTALLRAAEEAGARGANGLSMLLYQGALSFSLWFNREAPINAMRSAL